MAQREMSNSSEQLRKSRDEYRSRTEQFRQLLDKVSADLRFADAMWQGEAKEAFVRSMSEKLENLEGTLREFEEMSDDLDAAYQEYVSCESNVHELIRALV